MCIQSIFIAQGRQASTPVDFMFFFMRWLVENASKHLLVFFLLCALVKTGVTLLRNNSRIVTVRLGSCKCEKLRWIFVLLPITKMNNHGKNNCNHQRRFRQF